MSLGVNPMLMGNPFLGGMGQGGMGFPGGIGGIGGSGMAGGVSGVNGAAARASLDRSGIEALESAAAIDRLNQAYGVASTISGESNARLTLLKDVTKNMRNNATSVLA